MISYFGAVPGIQGYIVVKFSNIFMELFYGKYTVEPYGNFMGKPWFPVDFRMGIPWFPNEKFHGRRAASIAEARAPGPQWTPPPLLCRCPWFWIPGLVNIQKAIENGDL